MVNFESEDIAASVLRRSAGKELTLPRRFTFDHWCLMGVPAALTGAAVSVPWLLTHHHLATCVALYRGFSFVCHQRPERSFYLLGAPVAVCARCLGIYTGAAMGMLWRTSRRMALRVLIAAASINALDVGSEFAGLHGNWMIARFVLGMMLGAAGAMLIASSMPENPPPAEAGSVVTM